MDTNLKKSKIIRALFYRLLAAGSFVTFVVALFMGIPALKEARHNPHILSGNYMYLTDFQKYVGELYNRAMLGFAGMGDDNGYPLTDDKAKTTSSQARKNFLNQVATDRVGIIYCVKTPAEVHTNVSYPLFSEYDGHVLLPDNVTLLCYWNGENLLFFGDPVYTHGQYQPNAANAGKISLVMAKENVQPGPSSYFYRMAFLAEVYRNILFIILISGAVLLLSLLLCLFSHKAAVPAKAAYADFSKKTWLEFKLLCLGILLVLHYFSNFWVYVYADQYRTYPRELCLFFFSGIFLYLFVTDLLENGTRIFDRFLPTVIYRFIREWMLASKWYRKAIHMRTAFLVAVLLIFCSSVLILTGSLAAVIAYYKRHHTLLSPDWTICIWAALLFFAGIWLLFMYIRLRRFVRDAGLVADKLSDMQQGLPDKPLRLPVSSLLYETAQNTNKLADGIENAVEQKNRSNKLRVELLTNVSHDLKTPLTSIINYADLLCEEDLPDTASEYAHALQAKAYRLKDMVQDVFDLSKATSGNLPVEKHTLDLAKLIRQTLADMDERIQASDLTFKTFFSSEPVYIDADGDKLYRVFQNLFVNALQYSLANSRVHIQLSAENGYAYAKIKNTSRDELSFDTQDILERFVRADTSRTTEGSGLGLSIAQSYTEACGGTFAVETDADMFTALLCFPLTQPPESTQALPE